MNKKLSYTESGYILYNEKKGYFTNDNTFSLYPGNAYIFCSLDSARSEKSPDDKIYLARTSLVVGTEIKS